MLPVSGSNTANASQRLAKSTLDCCVMPMCSTNPAKPHSLVCVGVLHFAAGIWYFTWSWYWLPVVNNASGPVRNLVRWTIGVDSTLGGGLLSVAICGGLRSAWATLGSVSFEKVSRRHAPDVGAGVIGGVRAGRDGRGC